MSRRQVYRWIQNGDLPSTKIDGSRRISEKHLAKKVGEETAETVFDAYEKEA
jgi:phosphoribosyl-ATP pyrophosphohydrolase